LWTVTIINVAPKQLKEVIIKYTLYSSMQILLNKNYELTIYQLKDNQSLLIYETKQ